MIETIREELEKLDPENVIELIVTSTDPNICIYEDGKVILWDGEPNPLYRDYEEKISLKNLQEIYLEDFRNLKDEYDEFTDVIIKSNFIYEITDDELWDIFVDNTSINLIDDIISEVERVLEFD